MASGSCTKVGSFQSHYRRSSTTTWYATSPSTSSDSSPAATSTFGSNRVASYDHDAYHLTSYVPDPFVIPDVLTWPLRDTHRLEVYRDPLPPIAAV